MSKPPAIDEIRAAAERLREVVVRTPLVPLAGLERRDDVLLKPEILQAVGSFKIRGVYNAVALLDTGARARGLSTVSAGNTAQALAWTARRFGVTARSVMPDTAPAAKVEAVRRLGGEPVLVPVEEVFRFLKERLWEREPYAFIDPWTSRDVMTGHGSLGLEIVEDLPGVGTVYVPVGGGGLIGGVAAAVKALRPAARVVGVEPEGCPSLHESLRQGRAASVACRTICDGVAVPYMTEEVFAIVRPLVDDVVLVSDDEVRATIRRLALRDRIVVEPAGALAVAAAVRTPREARGVAVALVTGGSIDTDLLVEILGAETPGA